MSCLRIYKSEPSYAYKRYAYAYKRYAYKRKNMYISEERIKTVLFYPSFFLFYHE